MDATLVVKYPDDCQALVERAEYLARLYEALRRRHNAMGARYASGELSESEWAAFLRDDHGPRWDAVWQAQGDVYTEIRRLARELPDGAPELDIPIDAAFETREGA